MSESEALCSIYELLLFSTGLRRAMAYSVCLMS